MKAVWRGVGLVAAVLMMAACGDAPGVGMSSDDWDMLYQAQLTREKAMGIAAQTAQTWKESQPNRRRAEAARGELDQLTRESSDVLAAARGCRPTDKDALCTASAPLPDQLRAARTSHDAAQAASAALQTTYDGVVQGYQDARAPWNAWLRTFMLMLANNDKITNWSGFRRSEQAAVTAAQAFVGKTPQDAPDRALRAKADDLQKALSTYQSSVLALSGSIVTARGQIPESGATVIAAQGPIPSQPTGAAAPSTGISVDPTGFINTFVSLWTDYAQKQAERAAQARDKMMAQLQTFMWPDYECFVTPTPGCPGFSPARGSASVRGSGGSGSPVRAW